MGTKLNPGQFDCYDRALPNEPRFTFLARDPMAPDLIEMWADLRLREIKLKKRPRSDGPQLQEARDCAKAMRQWRIENAGKW